MPIEKSTLYDHFPALSVCEAEIEKAIALITDCYKAGGKLLIAGNGGSASDSEHIVGELMKGFLSKRPVTDKRIPPELAAKLQGALPAISLSNGLALPTAYLNDVDGEYSVAQALYGLSKPGDIFLAISTSGSAKNLCHAAELANCLGVTTIGLTGAKGGTLYTLCSLTIRVPETETYRVQEYHLPVYHELCARVEMNLF